MQKLNFFRKRRTPPLWTSEKLFFDGDLYFSELLSDLDQAQSYITVEMYIFELDAIGIKVFETINRAAERGVKVQILLDGVGSHRFIIWLQSQTYHSNIRIKVFNPHPWTFNYNHMIDLFIMVKVFTKRLLGVNRRNHRKIVTIDEHIVWTGSFNISESHSKEFKKEEAWEDIGLRLTGWIAPLLVLALKRSWSLREFFRYQRRMPKRKFVSFKHPDVRLNQDIRLRRKLYKDFLNRIKRSRRRIWLRTGYFTPKRRIVRKLVKAAKRGVDVKILLSKKSDVFYYSIMQTTYYDYLVKNGVKIYEFDPTITHAKNYFIDYWVTVGSSNLNYRSFMHDLELDLKIIDIENQRTLEEHFIKLCEASKEITIELLNQRPWYIKIASRLMILFRYWN